MKRNIKKEGIIEKLKVKLKTELSKAHKEYEKAQLNINNTSIRQKGGMDPGTLGIIGAVIKIGLMTIGTYVLDWWPSVFLISFMCAYIEYRMTNIVGQSIVGLPLL